MKLVMKRNQSRLRYWLNLITVTVLSLALTFFILVIYASNRWVQSTVTLRESSQPGHGLWKIIFPTRKLN